MSSAAINPLGSGEAGPGSLAERWQQVAAVVARPDEGVGQPGDAAATAGASAGPTAAAPLSDAAGRLPPTSAGAATGAVPRTSMLDSLPPAQASAAAHAAAIRPTGSPASAADPGSTSAQGAPTAAVLAQPAASTGTTPRPTTDVLQVPVAVSPLFTTSSAPLRRSPLPATQRRPVPPVQPRGQQHGHDAPPDDEPEDTDVADLATSAATGAPAQEADAPVPGTAPAQPDLLAWRALLQQGGHQALLRELDLRRHILLVCPQPALPGDLRDRAVAWLLGGPQQTALALHACFVAPARLSLPAQWRLHRTEGGAQDGLRSRPPLAGTTPVIGCRITFGGPPALPDPMHAHLTLAQPRRFLRALAGQWSLLLLVWPEGAAA